MSKFAWTSVASICIMGFASTVEAQLTGSGTKGTVPVFTESSAVGDSPIAVSSGNVVVGGSDVNKVAVAVGNSDGSPTFLDIQASGSSGFGINGWANAGVIEAEAPNGLVIGSINAVGNGVGGPITFQINRSPVAVISTSGEFDVAGKIRSSTGFVFPDGTIQETAFNPVGAGSGSAITENNGTVQISNSTTGCGNELEVFNSTNYALLTVQGSSPCVGTWPANSAVLESNQAGLVLDAYGSNPILLQNNRVTAMTVASGGNVGIGTTNPGALLEVNGNTKLDGPVTYPDGTTQATAWNGLLGGGDYAESVDVSGDRTSYEAGDVILIDATTPGKFTKSSSSYSRLIAGVFSTKPGLVGRRTTAERPDKASEVPMAMMGIVPVKVSTENGAIETGDLLVSANTPGYAMKGTDEKKMRGTVIGKALAPLKAASGLIEVLVSLQ
ncbi:hypothetical protein [Granulicella sp. dw_53]|uniref:hypothetical protein n=1 Tax=Granulicella sp. dw_53 TaxID=2719792 RepID=UPI001BD21EE5|nr:hypothetical protein [Granulicella sp. dw_53]